MSESGLVWRILGFMWGGIAVGAVLALVIVNATQPGDGWSFILGLALGGAGAVGGLIVGSMTEFDHV